MVKDKKLDGAFFCPYSRMIVSSARPFPSAGTTLKQCVEIGLAIYLLRNYQRQRKCYYAGIKYKKKKLFSNGGFAIDSSWDDGQKRQIREGLFYHKRTSGGADKGRLTNEFECEDTMGHGPLDIVLLRGGEVITCQQVHLEEDRRRSRGKEEVGQQWNHDHTSDFAVGQWHRNITVDNFLFSDKQ